MKEVTRKDIQQDTMSHLSTQHLIQAANQAVSWREKNCESAAEDEVTQVIAAMAPKQQRSPSTSRTTRRGAFPVCSARWRRTS